jgi:hypothetical protein
VRPRGRSASVLTDFYRVCGVNAYVSGRLDGNFHPKTSIMTVLARYVRNKELSGYDKMGQLRWLLSAIRDRCRRAWKLAKFVTIDEMILSIKAIYAKQA